MCVPYSGILGHRCGSRYQQLCAYFTVHLSTFSACKFEGYASFCLRCVSGLRPDKWVLMQQDVWWLMQVSELVGDCSYTFLDFTFQLCRKGTHHTWLLLWTVCTRDQVLWVQGGATGEIQCSGAGTGLWDIAQVYKRYWLHVSLLRSSSLYGVVPSMFCSWRGRDSTVMEWFKQYWNDYIFNFRSRVHQSGFTEQENGWCNSHWRYRLRGKVTDMELFVEEFITWTLSFNSI